MSQSECISCRRLNAKHTCGVCSELVCKSCVQVLSDQAFALQPRLPEELSHIYYCFPCFEQHVVPAQEKYEGILGQAKEVLFFFQTQRKPIPLISKGNVQLQVAACVDRDETILRLGFMAAEQGQIIEPHLLLKLQSSKRKRLDPRNTRQCQW